MLSMILTFLSNIFLYQILTDSSRTFRFFVGVGVFLCDIICMLFKGLRRITDWFSLFSICKNLDAIQGRMYLFSKGGVWPIVRFFFWLLRAAKRRADFFLAILRAAKRRRFFFCYFYEPRSGEPIFFGYFTSREAASRFFLAILRAAKRRADFFCYFTSREAASQFFLAILRAAKRASRFFVAILNPRKWCFPGIY